MKLHLADFFVKTAEEARVRTSSGGAVSLAVGFVLVWLLYLQVQDYLSISWAPNLVVDPINYEKMTITIDVTFPNLPCELLSIDQMDDLGNVQQDLDSQLTKLDLDGDGHPLDASIKEAQRARRDQAIAARGSDYEGPCWGAESGLPAGQTKCMTCADVRRAYAVKNWQFHDGNGFSQCVEEGYPEHVLANKDNGCRVQGEVQVSKVVGKLHFAPGESFFKQGQHSHDLSTYLLPSLPYDFSHHITEFSFGDRRVPASSVVLDDPLVGYSAAAHSKQYQFKYFMKVVGTDYLYKSGASTTTNRYSVTVHERPLTGGRDADHPNSIHKSGIPSVWFVYDISPMKVIETEVRGQSLGELVMNVFAIIGAVITTGALVDKGVYAVDQALKARKER